MSIVAPLQIDWSDSPNSPCVFAINTGDEALVALVDGMGSWGSGREAATWARQELHERWRDRARWSLDHIASDVSAVAALTPTEFSADEFGWTYSLVVLLCDTRSVRCCAAGNYCVEVQSEGRVHSLFRPRMLLDEFVAKGALLPEEVKEFAHNNVCLGPFIGDAVPIELTRAEHAWKPGDVAVVSYSPRIAKAPRIEVRLGELS